MGPGSRGKPWCQRQAVASRRTGGSARRSAGAGTTGPGTSHPRAVVAIYIPLIILAAIGPLSPWTTSSSRRSRCAIREFARHSETWIKSLLYIGTFGSFIGFGFAFGQVLSRSVPFGGVLVNLAFRQWFLTTELCLPAVVPHVDERRWRVCRLSLVLCDLLRCHLGRVHTPARGTPRGRLASALGGSVDREHGSQASLARICSATVSWRWRDSTISD